MPDALTLQTEILYTKAKAFLQLQKQVHIKYKPGKGTWHNGFIKELSPDYFILMEKIEGEIVVFFLELEDIDEYKQREERL